MKEKHISLLNEVKKLHDNVNAALTEEVMAYEDHSQTIDPFHLIFRNLWNGIREVIKEYNAKECFLTLKPLQGKPIKLAKNTDYLILLDNQEWSICYYDDSAGWIAEGGIMISEMERQAIAVYPLPTKIRKIEAVGKFRHEFND